MIAESSGAVVLEKAFSKGEKGKRRDWRAPSVLKIENSFSKDEVEEILETGVWESADALQILNGALYTFLNLR